MRNLIMSMLVLVLIIGCADTHVQQDIANRKAAIAAMPNGLAKQYAQAELDNYVLVQAALEQQRALAAAEIVANGFQQAGQTYARGCYTDPNIFANMQAARRGSYGNPIYVRNAYGY